MFDLQTIEVRVEGAVVHASLAAPPINLLGPQLVADLVTLILTAEADQTAQVLVFKSADPDFFMPHVDVTRVAEYRRAARPLAGEDSIALLFRRMSESRLVTIAQIEGRVGGAGSEFALACDMRFAARESAVFLQLEAGFGAMPGGGAVQHLTRLMGRGRALEVLLSAEAYDADWAERYGWINRCLPAAEIDGFVSALAHRIAGFPAAGRSAIRERVNAIALAPLEDFRRDSALFAENLSRPEAQLRTKAAFERGFQTREGELALSRMIGELSQADGPTDGRSE